MLYLKENSATDKTAIANSITFIFALLPNASA